MGYELHITRSEEWSDNVGREIAAREWLEYIQADPELVLDTSYSPYFAVWRGSPNGAWAWLDWEAGNIYAKSPDRPLIEKMVRVAHVMSARVQGDDGEWYPEALLEVQAELPPEQPRLPWWRRLFRPR